MRQRVGRDELILMRRMEVRTPAVSATTRMSRRVDIDEEDGHQDAGGDYDSALVVTSSILMRRIVVKTSTIARKRVRRSMLVRLLAMNTK